MKKIKVGGISLFNGIMFNSKYRQAVVQQINNGDITGYSREVKEDKDIINKIPVIRGIFGVISQVINAMPTFIKSDNETDYGENGNKNFIVSYLFVMLFLIGMPILISLLVREKYRGILQGFIILIEFMLYLTLLNISPDLRKIFMYHGAEHKAVNAFEKLPLSEITIENVKKQSRFHKRCGGNFLVYLVVLMILSYIFIPSQNLILKTIYLFLAAALNLGISFEIVNLFSIFPGVLGYINYPATLIQRITTKEPSDDMIKLAIYGVLSVGRTEKGIYVKEYIERYLMINDKKLENIEVDKQDIFKIIEFVINTDINKLKIDQEKITISLEKEILLDKLMNKYYFENVPLQYITHKQVFYNETYYVDENVLIPRSDTEILVGKAIEYIEKEEIKEIIDLCSGSGCVGISIAKNSSIEKVEQMDISEKALAITRRNAINNGVSNKSITLHSDLLKLKISTISQEINNRVDMIVSNPPYIKTEIISTLDKNVQKEPGLALDGGVDGLDIYRRIFEEAKFVLKDKGLLMLEIGYDQLEEIKAIIVKNEEYEFVESVKDYGNNDRVVVCRFHQK